MVHYCHGSLRRMVEKVLYLLGGGESAFFFCFPAILAKLARIKPCTTMWAGTIIRHNDLLSVNLNGKYLFWTLRSSQRLFCAWGTTLCASCNSRREPAEVLMGLPCSWLSVSWPIQQLCRPRLVGIPCQPFVEGTFFHKYFTTRCSLNVGKSASGSFFIQRYQRNA